MEAKLYIGFPLEKIELTNALKALNHHLKEHFIDNGENYLHTLESEHTTYLGKQVPPLTSLETLENMQANIYSLLQKLIPEYPFKETPLTIFTKIIQ